MIHSRESRQTIGRTLAQGVLLAALVAAMLLAASPAHAQSTFTVTNTNDTGAGSLRKAIEDANGNNNPTEVDSINFDIPGTGVKTISPITELPEITGPVNINGYSQPGARPNSKAVGSDAVLKIELSGPSGGHALFIRAASSTVKGLVINRSGEGIRISGPDAAGNKVTGNYIGTDPSGTKDQGNGDNGVAIGGASNNTIGGASPATRNVISGNEAYGVGIEGVNSTGNKVMGNYIGTDRTGTKDLGTSDGVFIYEAPANTIGGTTAGARNVISANDEGVVVVGNSATGNKIVGNYLGTDASGTKDLGNDTSGVSVVDAPNNIIGGTTAGARNVIAFNGEAGVGIDGQSATGNRVLSNSIFSTVGPGIDLGFDGRTANDTKDPDTGPNGLQNKPILSSTKKGAAGATTVKGTLNSTPNKTFNVQFFSNPAGTDEGKTLLGSKSVSTNGSGDASISFSTNKEIRLGQSITATATGPGGNTSEFSAARKVVAR